MRKADIDKQFTEKISQFISEGYAFCTNTMTGLQNELCRVDLIKDNHFVRVMIQRDKSKEYRIVVGQKTVSNKDITSMFTSTVWNDSLETIWSKEFVMLGADWFIPLEDAAPIMELRKERRENARRDNVYFFPEKAIRIALPFLQRQPKMKSKRKKDIQFVCKYIRKDGHNEYGVVLRDGAFIKFKKKIVIRDDML